MLDTLVPSRLSPTQIGDSMAYFWKYQEYVHGWKARTHQRRQVAALQVLARGLLRHPVKSLDCEDCGELQACKPEHSTNKLMILAPPASGKTMTVAQFTAWMIGNSTLRDEVPLVGYVSSATPVAEDRALAIRKIIEGSAEYQQVFPTALPDKTKWGQGDWHLQRGPNDQGLPFPTMRAIGFEGQILSYRWPTLIVIDDPHSQGENLGAGEKEKVYRTWTSEIETRGALGVTPMVLICTRMAEDDLPGRLIKSDPSWVVLWHPALGEDEETYWPVEVVRGMPMGVSTEALLDKRRRDPRAFVTQYQAQPPSSEGHIYRTFATARMPRMDEVLTVYQMWDTAQTEKAVKRGSYTAMVEGLKLRTGQLFISNVWRGQVSPVDIWDKIQDLHAQGWERWGQPPLVRVEEKSSGYTLVDFLKRHTNIGAFSDTQKLPASRRSRGSADLVERSGPVSKVFESRMVLLPTNDEYPAWKEEYVLEMSAFPEGRFRDQVAATLLLVEKAFPMVPGGSPPPLDLRVPGWNLVR